MPLKLNLSVAAESEPVTLTEAKAHMNVTTTDDDTLINSEIGSATELCQEWQHRQYVHATWILYLDRFPSEIRVPLPPLSSVSTLTYVDTAGDVQALTEDTHFIVNTKAEPGLIKPSRSTSWPSVQSGIYNAVTLTFVAGYGADAGSTPERMKQAVLLLVANAYEFREPQITGTIITSVKTSWEALLWPDRINLF